MIILLDDVGLDIDIIETDEKITCIHNFEFKEAVEIILTAKQYYSFVGCDTSREFNVSEKRINELKAYIDDNIWRKQRENTNNQN